MLTAIDMLCEEALVVQWLSSKEMYTVNRLQHLDEAVCISDRANKIKKGMNPIILPPAMGK